jgi:hypothetical protein
MKMSSSPRYVTVVHNTVDKDQGNKPQLHTFGFIHTAERQADALRQLGKMAADPEIPFTWYDAAVVSQEMRNQLWDLQHASMENKEPDNNWRKRRG